MLKAETTSIPIVMSAPDPVRIGLVASLARPGGNVTGFAAPTIELIEKRIEIAREALPLHRIAVMGIVNDPQMNATDIAALAEFNRVGASMRIEISIPTSDMDIEKSLAWVKSVNADAIYILSGQYLVRNASAVVSGAMDLKLPVIGDEHWWAEEGALVTYFPDATDYWHNAADYVNRILRGTKPSDLPVQQSTKFQLVINLKTAKSLGLVLPPILLNRADDLIE
jgi:putative ABC transport system substrate-binding protein